MKLLQIGLLLLIMISGMVACMAQEKNTMPLVKLETLSQKVVINMEQMNLNNLLNVIRNNTDSKLILAPEFSGVEELKKIIALPKGIITLRELLDVICIQLEAKWIATGNNGDIMINPMKNTIITNKENDIQEQDLYSVEYAGKSLRRVLQDLHRRSGTDIVMTGDVGNIKVEVMMADASVEKILSYIAYMYDLQLIRSEDGVYRIGK